MLPTSAVIEAPTLATSKQRGNRDAQLAQDELPGESRDHRHRVERQIHVVGDLVGHDHSGECGRDDNDRNAADPDLDDGLGDFVPAPGTYEESTHSHSKQDARLPDRFKLLARPRLRGHCAHQSRTRWFEDCPGRRARSAPSHSDELARKKVRDHDVEVRVNRGQRHRAAHAARAAGWP